MFTPTTMTNRIINQKMISKKVVVIGAGASGLMAAGFAAENGAKVTLIEKNKRVEIGRASCRERV